MIVLIIAKNHPAASWKVHFVLFVVHSFTAFLYGIQCIASGTLSKLGDYFPHYKRIIYSLWRKDLKGYEKGEMEKGEKAHRCRTIQIEIKEDILSISVTSVSCKTWHPPCDECSLYNYKHSSGQNICFRNDLITWLTLHTSATALAVALQ